MNKKELLMGRADVLLRFLQRINKDRPDDLDPFLEDLDYDSENRPLVNQIVDTMIAENPALYEEYAKARKEVGLLNPYSSPDDKNNREYDEALGRFISQWSSFERTIRTFVEQNQDKSSSQSQLWWRFRDPKIPKNVSYEIDQIRRLRNQVVHGIEKPPPELLDEATDAIKKINEELMTHI